MKKAFVILLVVVFASLGTAAQEATGGATAQKESKVATSTGGRWHGRIVRTNDEKSTLDVAKGNVVKKVVYNDSTKWTARRRPAERSQFKEGSDVIVVGTYDEQGRLVATQIDLRR